MAYILSHQWSQWLPGTHWESQRRRREPDHHPPRCSHRSATWEKPRPLEEGNSLELAENCGHLIGYTYVGFIFFY